MIVSGYLLRFYNFRCGEEVCRRHLENAELRDCHYPIKARVENLVIGDGCFPDYIQFVSTVDTHRYRLGERFRLPVRQAKEVYAHPAAGNKKPGLGD